MTLMPMRWRLLAFTFWMAVAAGCSCNGDDEPDGNDGPAPDAGGGMAGMGAGPVTACASERCDLLDPEAEGRVCGSGEGCHYLQPSRGGDPVPLCQMAGSVQDGQPCEAPTDCAPGLGCSIAAEGGDGACHPYCCSLGEDIDCPTGQSCVLSLGGGVGFCDSCDTCDFVAVEEDSEAGPTSVGCSAGQGCYPVSPDSQCRLCLGSLRDLQEGALCDHANDCAPGLGCYSLAGGAGRCRRFCELMADDACDSGFRCEDNLGLGEGDEGDGTGLCVPIR